jgi:hypothetical protein
MWRTSAAPRITATDEAKALVIASANAAATTVYTDRFTKMTENALRMVGGELARHVAPSDSPGLFAPVSMWPDGKERYGGVLALKERAVIGWTVGTFRIQNYEVVVPYDSIQKTEVTTRPGNAVTVTREVLVIEATERYELVFANLFQGGRSIAPWLESVMLGAISLNFSDT